MNWPAPMAEPELHFKLLHHCRLEGPVRLEPRSRRLTPSPARIGDLYRDEIMALRTLGIALASLPSVERRPRPHHTDAGAPSEFDL